MIGAIGADGLIVDTQRALQDAIHIIDDPAVREAIDDLAALLREQAAATPDQAADILRRHGVRNVTAWVP